MPSRSQPTLLTLSDATAAPRKNDPHRDAWVAIRQVFPLHARAEARCIVTKEIGRGHQSRWRRVYGQAIGRAGEIGPFQAHPGWWHTGWNGNRRPLAVAMANAIRRAHEHKVRAVAVATIRRAVGSALAAHRSSMRDPVSVSRIHVGDCRDVLRSLPEGSVHAAITSPPYWGLRSYEGDDGMIGLEPTFDEHLLTLVEVFREVRRVLRDDGTLWLNYGDAYAGSWGAQSRGGAKGVSEALGRTGSCGSKGNSHRVYETRPCNL